MITTMHIVSHNNFSLSIKGCYCILLHAVHSPFSLEKNQKMWMITVSLSSVPVRLWEWTSLSEALQTNIWPAGGRRIKDKDINRGRGATRGQRGPIWVLKGHNKATEEAIFLRLRVSREQRVVSRKTYMCEYIFEKGCCLHTLQREMHII